MIETLLKAVSGISIAIVGLLVVQTLLARTNRTPAGEDPLEGRLGCGDCGCGSACKKRN
ncbi:hypothetical protein LOC68_05350 [Blastopirellula sp. JC732]|uniref:FeoB-associated Cys-rich membrane protein n=1 Tax=Blastopirellula sediminis TaxID=2894196 RepID=A0A9X1MIP7_9BACT|nr:hypothetical protein [Blastopirellula sediminis]MCC9609410.1 hypothetical protein [Blastopirellula sediminis]MCC9627813.1 hypothetical protein [Blastopirellula sediminis]